MTFDVIVIGAGPAGLAFVRALAGNGLSVAAVERQPVAALADPDDDGRAIALTHRSAETLRALGAWQRIDPAAISPLRAARVLDGRSPVALAFDPGLNGADRLGQLVPNHLIRRALFEAARDQSGLTMIAGSVVEDIETGSAGVAVTLAGGRRLRGRLLVAADSRFSTVRERLGIGARVRRLDGSMLLARVAHPLEHDGVATEWFDYGHTVAMLPLPGRETSVVLTLPHAEAARVAALDPDRLDGELTRRTSGRLGPLRLLSGPNVYPLATVWSRHFAAPRAALIGDAAVGMHPVTAHGFNLGLRGAESLGRMIGQAAARGSDLGAPSLLRRYEAAHRLAAGPIFVATEAIVRLYTDGRAPARVARPALLALAAGLPPLRSGVSHALMRH